MDNVYSLLIGLLVVVLLVILIYLSTITHEVGSWITWCYNIKHIRSLPSPPGHWIWGHIAEVKLKTLTMLVSRSQTAFSVFLCGGGKKGLGTLQ